MIDVKIISIQDLLTISAARFSTIVPLSLIIEGLQFDQATRVVINDVDSPEFMVISPHQLIAQVPDGEVNTIISKVAVMAEKPSPTRKSLIFFDANHSFKSLQGIERLVQVFIKIILQTPGSDKFEPTIGGGLMTLIGQTFGKDSGKALQGAAVTASNRARDQIIAIQAKNSRLPNDERLLTATVESVGFNSNTTTLSMRVLLTAVSGQQAVANLSF